MKPAKFKFPTIIVILAGDKTREARGVPMVHRTEFDMDTQKTVVVMTANPLWRPQDRQRAMVALRRAFLQVAGKPLVMDHYRLGTEINFPRLLRG